MQAFLSSVDESLYDPFTEKTFQWDAAQGSIYFFRDKDKRIDLYYDLTEEKAVNIGTAELKDCGIEPSDWYGLSGYAGSKSEMKLSGDMPIISICVTNDIPLKDILTELASQAEFDLKFNMDIAEGIAFGIREAPLDQVIEEISKKAGFDYSFENKTLIIQKNETKATAK